MLVASEFQTTREETNPRIPSIAMLHVGIVSGNDNSSENKRFLSQIYYDIYNTVRLSHATKFKSDSKV